MEKFFLFGIFIMIFKFEITEAQQVQTQILIRDRLVMVLCDQMEEYLNNGSFPEPIMIIPEKYKNFRAGSARKTDGGVMTMDDGPKPGDSNGGMGFNGRKVNKMGKSVGQPSANDLKYKEKEMRNKRETTTLQEDFDDCSKPGANCVLDLW